MHYRQRDRVRIRGDSYTDVRFALTSGTSSSTLYIMTENTSHLRSDVGQFLESIFAEDVHAKRVSSMADATTGVIASASLGIHAIGRGLASVNGTEDKHAIKQVDRLLSNEKFDPEVLFHQWVPFVLGDLTDVTLNMDWTDFDAEDQSQLVISLQTHHGRSIPVIWKCHTKSRLKNCMSLHQQELLSQLRAIVPSNVHVTIVADRGFGDQKLFAFMTDVLHFDYIIRFRGNIHVTDCKGVRRKANEWLGMDGRMRVLHNASITEDMHPVQIIVCVKQKGMKEAWNIASSNGDLTGLDIVRIYGKRFTIEEMFRDIKDPRFGLGMKWSSIKSVDRRDRMLLIASFAQALLTMLGQAGEDLGLDRTLKVNTSKKRTISLVRQGLIWFEKIPNMKEDRLVSLMTRWSIIMGMSEPFKSLFVMK